MKIRSFTTLRPVIECFRSRNESFPCKIISRNLATSTGYPSCGIILEEHVVVLLSFRGARKPSNTQQHQSPARYVVRVLSVAPSGCTRFNDVYNFRQTSCGDDLYPTATPRRQSLAQHLLGKRLLRNRAVIIRKAELTEDVGYRVRARFPIAFEYQFVLVPWRLRVRIYQTCIPSFLHFRERRAGDFN